MSDSIVADDDAPRPSRYVANMTLRELFAAKAMQGMCSGVHWPDPKDFPEIARLAWLAADAMLAAE